MIIKTIGPLILLISSLMMSACSDGQQLGSPQREEQVQSKNNRIERDRELLKNELGLHELECNDPLNCPNFVGMVLSAQNNLPWRCSGVLIDQSTLLTAAHCLPAHLRAPQTKCQGELYFLLPEGKYDSAETLECDTVHSINTLSWRPYDYALIKLTKSSQRRINTPLNNEGRFHGQPITLWQVETTSTRTAKISSTQCQLNSQSLMSLYFDSHRSPLIQYSGCETRQGSSGGAILSGDQRLLGIHSASIKETNPAVSSLSSLINRGRANEIGQGTNLGCLCYFGDDLRPCTQFSSCLGSYDRPRLEQNRLHILEQYSEQEDRRRGLPLIERARSNLRNDDFQWGHHLSFAWNNEEQTSFSFLLGVRPKCLKDSIHPFDLPWNSKNEIVYRDLPLCLPQVQLNSHLEISRLSPVSSEQCDNVDIIIRRRQSEYFEIELDYLKNGRPVGPRPLREVIRVPRC